MSGRRLLLTGANGFIGGHVLAHLPRQFDVHAVSRNVVGPCGTDVTWHCADLRDSDACRRLIAKVRPDVLIHCAWETGHGQFWESASNETWLKAGKALFSEFVSVGGTRLVATGTCAEYLPRARPLLETDDNGLPTTQYGRAKLSLFQYLATLPISHAWVRIFNAYGAGEDIRRFVPSVACALAENRVAKCSSGQQMRDFTEVRDIGRAIAALIEIDHQGALNIGSQDPRPLGDIAQALGRISGRPDLIGLGMLPDRQAEAPVLVPDTKQLAGLGLMPRISLEAGLTEAWRYWSLQKMKEKKEAETT